MLRLPDASGHDRCHVMRAQGCIIISQYDLAFLWMRYNTGLKVVAHGPYRSAAKVRKPRFYRRKSVIGNLSLKSDIYG